jgi:soluble lytic murein transglycosylase-like protein
VDAVSGLWRASGLSDSMAHYRAPALSLPLSIDPVLPAPQISARDRTLELLEALAHPSLRSDMEAVAETIVEVSTRHDLEPELLLAMIHTESSFRPDVRSRAGAIGLMQLLPGTGRDVARELGIPWEGHSTLRDPEANIRMGSAYLAELRDAFNGDLELALSAYNLGPARLKRHLRRGRRPSFYARKVERMRQEILRLELQKAAETVPAVPTSDPPPSV